MKNLSKKFLSILMAAAMVVTMLPISGIVAFATPALNETHLVGAYLVDNATDGILTNNDVSWENGWAVFDGDDWLQIDGHPLESVSHTKAFTISFDFQNDANSDEWRKLFEFTDGTTNKFIGYNASCNNNWRRHTLHIKNSDLNNNERCYYGNDWDNGNYFSTRAGNNAAYFAPNGSEHNIVISMNTSGVMSFYVDNTLRAVSKSDYGTVAVGGNVYDNAVYSLFKDLTNYYIGRANSGQYFIGKIKNFYLFDAALTYDDVVNEVGVSTSNINDLTNAMYQYEVKTNSGTLYTNMTPAYDAYRRANKLFDSYFYGNDSSITAKDIGLATAILYHTTANMNAFASTGISGSAQGLLWNANAVTTNDGYYNNILYSSGSTTYSGATGGNDKNSVFGNYNFKIQMSKYVALIYDGTNNCYFPVRLESKRKDNKSRYFFYFENLTSGFMLSDYWYGYGSTWNGWDTANDYLSYNSTFGKLGYDSSHINVTSSENFSSSRSWKNKLRINPSTFVGDTTNYYSTVSSITMHGYINGAGPGNAYDNGDIINDQSRIYVINYKALLDLIPSGTGV